jgi:putative lipoic acid-binding regulatory protein
VKSSFGDREPEISYPTTWGYRIIGQDEAAMRQAVSEVLGELDHELRQGNRSAQGNYLTLILELVVTSREQRRAIFQGLAEHPAVRVVI